MVRWRLMPPLAPELLAVRHTIRLGFTSVYLPWAAAYLLFLLAKPYTPLAQYETLFDWYTSSVAGGGGGGGGGGVVQLWDVRLCGGTGEGGEGGGGGSQQAPFDARCVATAASRAPPTCALWMPAAARSGRGIDTASPPAAAAAALAADAAARLHARHAISQGGGHSPLRRWFAFARLRRAGRTSCPGHVRDTSSP